MKFELRDSLLDALRARRTNQRHDQSEARRSVRQRVPSGPPSLIDSVKKLFSGSSDVGQVAAQYVDGMDQLQVAVEDEHDAFLLDPGMGPMTYITSDGRVLLDMRRWAGEPMREASDDEAIAALVVGGKKTSIGELLDLISTRPFDGLQCPMCWGTRWFTFGEVQLVCPLCRGRGWATRETISRAEADGTWPLRQAASPA